MQRPEDVVGVEGGGEVVPLARVHSERLQPGSLFLGLDPFGHDFEVQRLAQLHERLNDRSGLGRRGQARHEGSVDLQNVDRELLEIGQRGEAGAEIVDRQAGPGPLELQAAGRSCHPLLA